MNKDYNINHFDIIKNLSNITPSIISLNDIYNYNSILPLIKDFKIINKLDEYTPYEDNEYIIDSKLLTIIDDGIYMSYIVSDVFSDTPTISSIVFYKSDEKVNNIILDNLINSINKFSLDNTQDISKENDDINNLNYLSLSKNGMYLSPLEIKNHLDIDLCYNKDTLKEIKELDKQIKKNKLGIWILHGKTGNGKTSSLKYLSDKNKNINFTYITYSSLDLTINSHDIHDFILNNNQMIFIIDDFENLYDNFDVKLNQTLVNISQIMDNFLFKDSKVGFIIIVNTNNITIDNLEQLYSLNSFINSIEFKELEKSKIDKLIKNVNKDFKLNNKARISLSDIINNKKTIEKNYTGF